MLPLGSGSCSYMLQAQCATGLQALWGLLQLPIIDLKAQNSLLLKSIFWGNLVQKLRYKREH